MDAGFVVGFGQSATFMHNIYIYIYIYIYIWAWLKIKQEGQTAGFGPCFHLPIGQPSLEFLCFFEPQPYLFISWCFEGGAS